MFNFGDWIESQENEVDSDFENLASISSELTDFLELSIEEKYEEFLEFCASNKPLMQSKLNYVNELFRAKYVDFKDISFDETVNQIVEE